MAYRDLMFALKPILPLPVKVILPDEDKIFITVGDPDRADHPYTRIRVYYKSGDPYNYQGPDELEMKTVRNETLTPIESPRIYADPIYNVGVTRSHPPISLMFHSLS
jgi:hypothetical protein